MVRRLTIARSNVCLGKRWVTIVLLMILLYGYQSALANETVMKKEPTRYGLGIVAGDTYRSAEDLNFMLLTGFALFDYDRIWPHSAPDSLYFKVEGSLGATTTPWTRAMVSANIMACYYLDFLTTDRFRPYIEGGIGVIYTDFQLEDQGLKFNFNPQAGIGMDIITDKNDYGDRNKGITFFLNLRLHHISNAGFHEDNRGINSVTLTLGCYFF